MTLLEYSQSYCNETKKNVRRKEQFFHCHGRTSNQHPKCARKRKVIKTNTDAVSSKCGAKGNLMLDTKSVMRFVSSD